MSRIYVLEQRITHRSEAFQLKFAREALALLDGTEAVAGQASHAGLSLLATEEAPLMRAVRTLRVRYGDLLRVGAPSVVYRRDPVLMEPVMSLQVVVPPCHESAIERNLLGRGAVVLEKRLEDAASRIHAEVPMAKLLGYGDYLQRATGGTGSWQLAFGRYAPVDPGGGSAA